MRRFALTLTALLILVTGCCEEAAPKRVDPSVAAVEAAKAKLTAPYFGDSNPLAFPASKGEADVKRYIETVTAIIQKGWARYFGSLHIQEPVFRTNVLTGSTKGHPGCGLPIDMGADSVILDVYCGEDGPGTVWWPATTLHKEVFGPGVLQTDEARGLAAALLVSEAVAHDVYAELQTKLGATFPPIDDGFSETSICLAGISLRSVYTERQFAVAYYELESYLDDQKLAAYESFVHSTPVDCIK